MLHLIYLQITNKKISGVTGFIIPKVEKKDGSVTVNWNMQTMKFCGILDPISRQNVQKSLVKIITGQDAVTSGCVLSQRVFYFQDSISLNEVEIYLSKHSIGKIDFFPSKYSIIFKDPVYGIVYKRPLIDNNLHTLLQISKPNMQVLYPQGVIRGFYSFPLLHPPLSLELLRKCFTTFAISTLHAVELLHKKGYAHLDIRIPNICFKQLEHGWQVVLIDMDGAVGLDWGNSPAVSLKSLMYNQKFKDPTHYDWCQFALLLSRIIEGSDDEYHTRPPVFKNSKEETAIKTSFEYGTKPPLWAMRISLVESPKTLDDLLPLIWSNSI